MADKKVTAAFQRIMKFVNQFILRFLIEIDHDVPAEDDVEPEIRRWRLHEIETAEIYKLPYFRLDPEEAGGGPGAVLKIATEDIFRQLFDLFFGVDTVHGGLQDPGGNIRGRYFNVSDVVSQGFFDEDRQGIRFFPGGTAGAPDLQPGSRTVPVPLDLEKNRFHPLKVLFLPKKIGQVRGQGIDHRDQLVTALRGGDVPVIIGEGLEISFPEALSQSGLDQLFFSVVEIDPAEVVNQTADLLKLPIT